MSNIDKQELRSKARSASAGEWIKESGDGWEAICSSDDQANGNFIIAHFEGPDAKANREFSQTANPATVLALLDELEAEKERSEEFLRQARSFREAHESASEIIRKLERNKPAVKLPTTRLWAGKIACYEESEVVAMLEGAGISIAAGIGKGVSHES